MIAAIDEKSLGSLGRWPWDRDKIAQLVKRLIEEGAEIIVFDIFFFEKEKNDTLLGQSIQKAGNVILPLVFEFDKASNIPDSEFLLNSAFRSVANAERLNQYSPITAKRVLIPVPEVMRDTMALGHINMFPDHDGTLRWEAMAIEYQGYLFPSIDLQVSAIYLGIPQEKIILKATQGIQLGEKRTIPTDRYGRSLIYYYGSWQTFNHFSI